MPHLVLGKPLGSSGNVCFPLPGTVGRGFQTSQFSLTNKNNPEILASICIFILSVDPIKSSKPPLLHHDSPFPGRKPCEGELISAVWLVLSLPILFNPQNNTLKVALIFPFYR